MRQWMLALMVAVVGLGSSTPGWAGPEKMNGMIKVGTFDPRTVALAYARSKTHGNFVKGVMAEHAAAKAAGNTRKMRELQSLMSRNQDDAHRQVFGVGPYDSLADQLKGILAEVAKAEGLSVIAPKLYWAADQVQTVDVTEAIITRLGTDEQTRKIIDEMNRKIRSGEYKPEEFKGEKD